MRSSDIRNLYAAQLNRVFENKRRVEIEQEEKEREAYLKTQNDYAKLNAGLSILNMGKDIHGNIVSSMKSQTYGKPSYIGGGENAIPLENKRFQEKHDANWLERLFLPLEETEGYKKFKLERNKKEALEEVKDLKEVKGLEEGYQYDPATGEPMKIPASGRYSATKPDEALDTDTSLPEGYQYDPATGEPILISDYQANQVKLDEAYNKELDEFQFSTEDAYIKPEKVASKSDSPLSWTEDPKTYVDGDVFEDSNQFNTIEAYLSQQGVVLPENMSAEVKRDLLDSIDEDVFGASASPEKTQNIIKDLKNGLNNPDKFEEIVKKYSHSDFTDIGEGFSPKVDLLNPKDNSLQGRFQKSANEDLKVGLAEDKKLQQLRDLQTTPGVTPKVSSDSDLDKALLELENLEAPEVKGGGPLMASAATGTDAPMSNQVDDGSGITMGKTFSALQNTKQMIDIGTILTDKETTAEQKGVASVQGLQMMSDLAAKKAGQETISQLGNKAIGQLAGEVAEEGLKKGVKDFSKQGLKLSGKQAAGTALGGAMGGYMMVTEGKAASESWKEGDYDEAVLQGIGSVSGGLQAAGAGMMLTGVGAPIGAVLYGVGAAGSVISGVGQMVENLFEKQPEPKQQSQNRPKFSASHYLNSIRNR